jgi:pimeloyl-ACP methyl ester carboxylesterase
MIYAPPIPKFVIQLIVSLALIWLPQSVEAQTSGADPIDWSGDWHGQLVTPGGNLRLVLHVAQSAEQTLTATLESLDQAPGQLIPVGEIAISDGVLSFSMPALNASYIGTWDATVERFSGQFSQGMQLPLDWARSAQPEPVAAPPIRPQTPGDDVDYRVQDITFDNSQAPGVTLAGTLTLPSGDGPFPAAILISGSGPQDRDETVWSHKPFAVLADWLTRQGIAVLRYDDRGVAASTGQFSGSTSGDFATDANAALAWLLAHDEIDTSAIGFIGHSEGGLIGPVAAINNPHLAYMVFLAAPGVDTYTITEMQRRVAIRAGAATEAQVEASSPIQAAVFEAAVSDMDNEGVAAAIHDVLTEDRMQALSITPAQRDGIIASAQDPWFRYFARYDPAPVLAQIDIPILALNGSLDVQIDADVNLAGLETALAHNQDVTLNKLDGLNHMFQTAQTGMMSEYAQIEETFSPDAMALISEWILARYGSAQ